MPGYCFAPGCESGYPSARRLNKATGKKNPSLFTVPKGSKLLEKWQKAIPRKDKIFNITDRLCELHFEENCISRMYETILPDGSVSFLERGKPCLKPGSVPTRFPNLPKYISVETSKRKSRTCNNTKSGKKKRLNVNAYGDNDNDLHTEFQQQSSDFVEFVHHLKDIQLPDSWWSVALTEEYVVCAKWNSEFSCERRVVVCKDFSVKIFLRSKEIPLDIEVCNVESLSSLLQCVNHLVIWEDIE